ncbi:hypothetical protein BDN70DRAFT_110899 [Pholiota conissans]|uniref:Pheromone receptor n=1 Tax=Pholiota conissans TaxID=109636 RepID=A0A9P6CYF7_9AGAR|nr:hypothetical protein BDN70DRAFT_110899 [Pholiota conissans]
MIMTAIRAALSFTCAALIAVFAPVPRVRTSIPHVALIFWLGGYNLVHGIDALVWADNTDIHIPVWCDIVTKLMLGANIALPGAFLCIAIDLREKSRMKTPISTNPIVLRNRKILEVFLCYILPVIFMLSHLIVQDNRFDIVKGLGCSPATHPSTLGFVITWLPPVCVCALVFPFCAMSIHNSSLHVLTRFNDHIQSRSTMTASIFYRRVATCIITTGALSILNFAALFSIPNQPWNSWNSVHAAISEVNIVKEDPPFDPDLDKPPINAFKNIQIAWWGIFAISVIYIVLSFAIGEETRDAYRWVVEQVKNKKKALPKRLILPVYHITLKKETPSSPMAELVSPSPSTPKSQTLPLTLDLKSGWDDTITEKTPRRMEFLRSPTTPTRSPTPSSSSRPTSPSKRPSSPSMRSVGSSNNSMAEEDRAFMESTLTYLGSPTARTLGIAPLQVPPRTLSPPPRAALEIPPKPSLPPPSPPMRRPRPSPRYVPQDIDEPVNIGSVLNEAWPLPPASPTPSVSPSRHSVRRSRSHSPASSAEEATAVGAYPYPLFPTPRSPPHRKSDRPFDSASISSFVVPETAPPLPPSPSHSPSPSGKVATLVSPTMRTLSRKWSKDRLRQAHSPSVESIRMTVVRETV